jgi:tripeptide aminopeptidase
MFTTTASAQRRIARLATLTAVHRAFHWLHLHQPQLRQWQLEFVRIPAPPFGEAARTAWFLDRFEQLGLNNIHLDAVENALGEIGDSSNPETPCVLLSAHLDTVFPSGTNCEPVEDETTNRIFAPGICDNGSGLTALLAIAAALRYANIAPPIPLLFAANVGEEGEGDLRGMRHLFLDGAYRDRIAASIALEGGGTNAVVTRALGSLRFRVTVSAPGGHAWTDAGLPNPIFILSQAIARLAELELPANPRTVLNAGIISGGTSINSIPESATVLLDLRSTDPVQLRATEADIRRILAETVHAVTGRDSASGAVKLHIELIGDRPAAALPDDSSLLQTVRAVDRHLTLRTEWEFQQSQSGQVVWEAASIPCRSGTTLLAGRPLSAGFCLLCSTQRPLPLNRWPRQSRNDRLYLFRSTARLINRYICVSSGKQLLAESNYTYACSRTVSGKLF